MDTSLSDIALPPGAWVDLVTDHPALAGQQVELQCHAPGGGSILLVWGGALPAARSQGYRLGDGAFETGASDHIWVRSIAGNGGAAPSLSVTLTSAVGGGTGSGGATTLADGASVTLGAKVDAAATSAAGAWSVISLLKGAWAKLAAISGQLPASLGAKTGAASLSITPASDLANLEPGGSAITAAAMPAGGLGFTGWLSAIWAACTAPTPAGSNIIGSLFAYSGYTDSVTALGAGASWPGTARAMNSTFNMYNYFTAQSLADQPGTLIIERMLNGSSTWDLLASVATTANTLASLTIRMTGANSSTTSYRARYVNGATAQSLLRLSSAFSVN